jgi:hypothetical protein
MDVPNHAELVQRVTRVQELCETLARPTTAKGDRYMVTFDDGSAVEMKDVISQGREALAEVAALFGDTTSAGATHAG